MEVEEQLGRVGRKARSCWEVAFWIVCYRQQARVEGRIDRFCFVLFLLLLVVIVLRGRPEEIEAAGFSEGSGVVVLRLQRSFLMVF